MPATFVDIDHGQVGNYALDAFFSYAGYIVVKINSTSSDTYVNYACVSNLCTFNLQTDTGLNGTATFPVIPLDHWNYHPEEGIFITISTHAAVPAKMNVTMTYYY